MLEPIYGPLDESEDAVAAANDLAEKNDDPDMQMPENVNVQLKDDSYNCFNDGITKIGLGNRSLRSFSPTSIPLDYILVYEDKRATTVDQLLISLTPVVNNDENEKLALALQKEKDRHRLYKRRYLSNLSRLGLMMETVIDLQSSLSTDACFSRRMSERVTGVWSVSSKFTFPGP